MLNPNTVAHNYAMLPQLFLTAPLLLCFPPRPKKNHSEILQGCIFLFTVMKYGNKKKKKNKDTWIWFVDTFYVYEGRKIMGVSLCDLMSQSCCLKMSIQ